MRKSLESQEKDAQNHRGKFWVKDPKCNVRQASGVTFGGRWVTHMEFMALTKKNIRSEGER